jgi:hypothetical protein
MLQGFVPSFKGQSQSMLNNTPGAQSIGGEQTMRVRCKNYLSLVLLTCGLILSFLVGNPAWAEAGWIKGDWHTHTKMSDGSKPLPTLLDIALAYGLDFIGTSDHGGAGTSDPFGILWIDREDVAILGDYWENPLGYQGMWRWQALSEYAYPVVQGYRTNHPDKVIWQGFEWCAPGANDATVAILEDDRYAISEFEYMFCRYDDDTTGLDLPKINEEWDDALTAASWLQEHFAETGFISINHPSRSLDWSPGEIRDLHNAGPGVVIGMTAFPGHQKAEARGEYGKTIIKHNQDLSYKARTYGGTDYMTARLGGLWDSLLGEGRRFYVTGVSDYHNSFSDFWPGQYAKIHVYVEEKDDPIALVAALKAGHYFPVIGDLIDALDFQAESGTASAQMGDTLTVEPGADVLVTIRFHSPAVNNNGDSVAVDHIDMIAGEVNGLKVPGTSDYKKGETNSTTRVIARFDEWQVDAEGYNVIHYRVENLTQAMYFRLRGTNLGLDVPNETDADGNPLCDDLMGKNTEEKVWADLWFYSNPIFVEVAENDG